MLHFIFDLVEYALNVTLFEFIIIKHIFNIFVYIYTRYNTFYRIFHKCYISYLI